MRRAARVDDNQDDIVSALRGIGCSVQPLSVVGKGCPDLLVGIERQNVLLEVKDASKPRCDRVFTAAQKRWHREWKGVAHVVETVDQALAVVELYRGKRAA